MKTAQKLEVVEGRLVTSALATKGRSGKSATVDALGGYYDYLEVPWAGYCLDEVYRSFHSRHPDRVKALTVSGPHGANELLRVFRTTLNANGPLTTLADPPAQFADTFIETVNRVRYLALAKEKGVRMTGLLFVADEALPDIVKALQEIEGEEDYDLVAIRIPTLYSSRHYDGSPLQKTLLDKGAEEITMPGLMPSTLTAMARAEAKCGHALSFPAAVNQVKEDLAQADLEFFLSKAFSEFDRIARLLLPTAMMEKVKPAAAVPPGRKKNLGCFAVNLGDD